jgi:hypothetical protein
LAPAQVPHAVVAGEKDDQANSRGPTPSRLKETLTISLDTATLYKWLETSKSSE